MSLGSLSTFTFLGRSQISSYPLNIQISLLLSQKAILEISFVINIVV